MEYYDKYCACGCGHRIPIKKYHRYKGKKVPEYISGHNRKGAVLSELHKQILRTSRMGVKNTESHVQAMADSKRGRSLKELGHRDGCMCSACLRYRHIPVTKEVRLKINKTLRERWKDPEFVVKQMQARSVIKNKAETKLESILEQVSPGEWEFVGDGSFILVGKNPDFKHKTEKRLIELFGDYWHSEQMKGMPEDEHEQERIQLFENEGYQTLVIWEHELKDEEAVIERVMCFV